MSWFGGNNERPTIVAPGDNMESHQANPSERHGSTLSRPGKFVDLSQFARPKDPEEQAFITEQLEYCPVASLNRISAPHIIHIKEKGSNSRIHDRIMLVIRDTSPTSLTCLSFCMHRGVVHGKHCLDHAKLISDTDSDETATALPSASTASLTGDDSEYFKLHVTLEAAGVKLRPTEDVYINLEELWNIESVPEVHFAILGQATERYWLAARDKIIEVFASTVGGPDWSSRQIVSSDVGRDGEEIGEDGKGMRRRTKSPILYHDPEKSGRGKERDRDGDRVREMDRDMVRDMVRDRDRDEDRDKGRYREGDKYTTKREGSSSKHKSGSHTRSKR